MRNLCRHSDAFAQSGVRAYGFAKVHCILAHLNGNLGDRVVDMHPNQAFAQDFYVAGIQEMQYSYCALGLNPKTCCEDNVSGNI